MCVHTCVGVYTCACNCVSVYTSAVDDAVIEMSARPTLDEVKMTIKQTNTRKAPGLDGIPVELLRFPKHKAVLEQEEVLWTWFSQLDSYKKNALSSKSRYSRSSLT